MTGSRRTPSRGRGSGILCTNGAAARLISPGETVIAYAAMDDAEARSFEPQVVFVDKHNRIVQIDHDAGDVPDGFGLATSAVTKREQG